MSCLLALIAVSIGAVRSQTSIRNSESCTLQEHGGGQLSYHNICKYPVILWFANLARHRFTTEVIKRGNTLYFSWSRFHGEPNVWTSAICPVGFTPSALFPARAVMDGSYKTRNDYPGKEYRCLRLTAPTRCGPQTKAILVSKKPTHCGDEKSDFSCTCLALTNRCSYPVTAFYRFSAGKRSALQLKPDYTDDSTACTRTTSESVEYLGFRKTWQ